MDPVAAVLAAEESYLVLTEARPVRLGVEIRNRDRTLPDAFREREVGTRRGRLLDHGVTSLRC
jgi:hypothetical protein